MSRIYTDHTGSANAISTYGGYNVEGHLYQLVSGSLHIQDLFFQQGPIAKHGPNGTTNEAVIACLIHRLNHLNTQFPCRENSKAITKLEEALMWLEKRTQDRIARGVEGMEEL